MESSLPIIGKFYKVIAGHYIGFIGQCISYELEEFYPVILEDLEFNSRAVKLSEVRETLKQPIPVDIRSIDKN